MATIASRLANTGTLLVNGIFDEVTYTGDTTFASRTTANTIYTTGFFDEVTYSNASTLTTQGRYNLVSYSDYYAYDGSKGWRNIFTAGATLTTGIDAPDGTNTAVRFSCTNTTNALLRNQFTSFTPNGTDTYTMSFWARHISGSKTGLGSDLNDGVGYTYSSALVTGQWVRISYSGIPTASAKSFLDLFSDSNTNNVIDFWGPQVEKATSVSIYQPTYNDIINSPSVRKITSSGNYYIKEQFDEFTGAPVIDSSLKLWLDAAQTPSYNGSGSTWTDLSPSASNITLYGSPTYSDSVNGGRLQFVPASTQYGLSTANLGNMPTWTVEAWVRVTASLTGQVTSVVTNQYDLSTSLNYSIGTNNSPTNYNLCVGFFDGSWHNTLGVSPTLNTWFHIVGTYDGSTLTQYNNGSVTGSTLSYSGTPSSGGITRIARRWDDTTASTNLFPGDISVVRIYNRALTADEVSQNFNALRNRYGI